MRHFGFSVCSSPPCAMGLGQNNRRADGNRIFSLAPDIAYSAFPWPELNARQRERIENAAQQVLDVRKERASNTLAQLYNSLAMPDELVEAHRKLDRAVDAAYGRHRHTGDATRLPVLLRRYVELTDGDPTLFDEQS